MLLNALEQEVILGVASVPLMFEYESVLKRSEQLLAAGMTSQDVENILDMLAARLKPVKVSYLWRPQLRDPGDEMVLETAINGRANMLVSFNTLDFGEAPRRFGIELLRPGDAIRRLLWPGQATSR